MEVKKKLITEIVNGLNDEYKSCDFFYTEEDFSIMLKETFNHDF